MKTLIFFLVVSICLALCACNVVRIEPQPIGSGTITINQSSWKSNSGENNAVEATTSPSTDADLGLNP